MTPFPVFAAALAACVLAAAVAAAAPPKADLVVVDKSQRRLMLYQGAARIGDYAVALGGNPRGHKLVRGDERTPEGRYLLDYKKADSDFYRAIHVSYPNAEDRRRAAAMGRDPGGQIMIHGQKNGFGWLGWISHWFDWTDGCIALSNGDMERVWQAVDAGTPIEIRP